MSRKEATQLAATMSEHLRVRLYAINVATADAERAPLRSDPPSRQDFVLPASASGYPWNWNAHNPDVYYRAYCRAFKAVMEQRVRFANLPVAARYAPAARIPKSSRKLPK